MSSLRPAVIDLLQDWLPAQRWFPAKGRQVQMSQVGGIRLQDPAGEAELEVQLIAVDSGERIDVINVPLSYRSAPLADAGPAALIGTSEHPELGTRWVYDGAHDPVFVTVWLELMRMQATTADGHASGHATDEYVSYSPPAQPSATTVLGGEQSNTSVIIHNPDQPAIVKFFRVLSAGVNPDVEVGVGLTATGCEEVPATYGWVTGRWEKPAGGSDAGTSGVAADTPAGGPGRDQRAQPAEDADGRRVEGELSVLREFIPGSQDAWRQAGAAALDGADYTAAAAGLGRATAQVHLSLRTAFGSRAPDPAEREQFIEGIIARIEWAWHEAASAVGPYEQPLQDVIDAVRGMDALPDLQRIHGDYHLGQVLHSPVRGWIILDFEGEPLRSAAERSLADVPLRDVVGMLRSFDYVSGVVVADSAGGTEVSAESARQFSSDCMRAFVSGYERELGEPVDTSSPLFLALWLDKALYEVVYELRNRPDWLSVPVTSVREALGGHDLVPTSKDAGHSDAKDSGEHGKKEVD